MQPQCYTEVSCHSSVFRIKQLMIHLKPTKARGLDWKWKVLMSACGVNMPCRLFTLHALTRHFPRLEGPVFDIYRHPLDTEYLVLYKKPKKLTLTNKQKPVPTCVKVGSSCEQPLRFLWFQRLAKVEMKTCVAELAWFLTTRCHLNKHTGPLHAVWGQSFYNTRQKYPGRFFWGVFLTDLAS